MNFLSKIKLILWKLFHKEEVLAVENIVCFIGQGQTLPKPLEPDEELLLLEEASLGNQTARDKLVEHNLRLVIFIAKKFEGCGIEFEDTISIGAIGLIKAVKTYKVGKNIKLATYASRCIENEILMQLRKTSKRRKEVSLDEPLSADGDGNELVIADIISDDEDLVTKDIEKSEETKFLMKAIGKLDEREQQILLHRFGLAGNDEMTQKEVADMMGISQSYISRIEKKILGKMKKKLEDVAEL